MKKPRIAYLSVLFIVTGLLIACQENHIGTANSNQQLAVENTNTPAANQTNQESPEKVFSDFQQMIKK